MPTSTKGRIPRPPNAFILFRAHLAKMKREEATRRKESSQATLKKSTAEVREAFADTSKKIGQQFKGLSSAQRAHWDAEAEKAKAEHKELYPGYVFKPVRRSDKPARLEEKERTDADRTVKNTRTIGRHSNAKSRGSEPKARRTSSNAPYTVPSQQIRLAKSASPSFPSSPSDDSSNASSSFPPTPATPHSIPLMPHQFGLDGIVMPQLQHSTSLPTIPVPQPDFSALAFSLLGTARSPSTLSPPYAPFAETPKNDYGGHGGHNLHLNPSDNVYGDIGTFGFSSNPSYMVSGNFEREVGPSYLKSINTTTAQWLTVDDVLHPSAFEPDHLDEVA